MQNITKLAITGIFRKCHRCISYQFIKKKLKNRQHSMIPEWLDKCAYARYIIKTGTLCALTIGFQ